MKNFFGGAEKNGGGIKKIGKGGCKNGEAAEKRFEVWFKKNILGEE